MGFTSNASNTPLFSIRYSAFLGTLYLNDEAAAQALNAVKADIGEDTIKLGFQGLASMSPSAIALKKARENGVLFGRMNGDLTGVRLIEREIKGRKMPYLSLTLTDEAGKYNLSVSVAQKGAQMLIRKLANAAPGADTSVNLFATFEQRDGAARAYANHGATLKQSNAEVKGIDPKESLIPQVEAAVSALKAAGVSDQETIGKRRSVVETEFHAGLVRQIEAGFKQFYELRDQAEETRHPEPQGRQSFDEMDDDIPF